MGGDHTISEARSNSGAVSAFDEIGRWHDNATFVRADPGYRQLEVEDLTEEGNSKKQKPAKLSGGSLRVMGGPKQR